MDLRRKIVFDQLGYRCSRCGWEGNQVALNIIGDKLQEEFPYRAKYVEYCAEHPERCRVVCKNCWAIEMEGRRAKAEPKAKWFVWPCPWFQADVKYGLLEQKVKLGFQCAIYDPTHQQVWKYGMKYQLIGPWEEFRRVSSAPETPPETSIEC